MSKCFAAMLCVALLLVGCDRIDPDSPLGKRKAIFKEMMQTSEHLGGMLRGRVTFDSRAFADGAVRLDTLAHAPWQHFPVISEGDQSNARPQVWQQQARFTELAGRLERATAALREQTRVQPLEAARLKAPMDDVEQACTACHQVFRNH
ncbi:cytochrome c [Pseudomonas sp. RP23018S]|uniref:c-type cytochrome n=1 Tax=Pseudomonas sp. RP23018S TaxID=3096037 RepID=UPI002ACA1E12|nr:cytochrome c [Pseudomonas sp. RP23018S]MDZ5604199.1 cytochrome c [Pseudomonas sp. RP23018S]